MPFSKALSGNGTFIPDQWIGRDGLPLEAEDKISLLNDNLAEIHAQCQHAFTEAVQLGCSEEFVRIVMQNMVDSLKRNADRPTGN